MTNIIEGEGLVTEDESHNLMISNFVCRLVCFDYNALPSEFYDNSISDSKHCLILKSINIAGKIIITEITPTPLERLVSLNIGKGIRNILSLTLKECD